jgi:hypothetical protein
MAKQRKGTNVVDLIEPPPEGFNISREDWSKIHPDVRSETIRMFREMGEAIPIDRDRRAKGRAHRGKRVPGGFLELHCCERDGNLARAAELREILAPEIARIAENDSLAEYHDLAAKAGKRLPDVLQAYIEMESFLRRDPVAGIALLMRNLGLDPEAEARRYLAEPEPEEAA